MQELKKITLSDGGTGNQFGIAVATDGDIVVITALYNVNEDNTRGAAYIYEKDSKTGLYTQSAKLTTSDASTIYNDNFGASIAISDNTIVVGAPLNTTDGSVYIYEKPALGWVDATQSAKLTSSERASSDRFGSAVAISGNVIVVGAFGTRGEVGTGNIGSVYIYVNYNRNWVDMTETAILTSSIRGNNHYFGESVAIDGDTVIVGASGTDTGFNNSGTVYLYEKPTSGWISSTENVKLTASNAAYNTRLGTSVSISNDIIVVGALGYLDYNAHSSAAVYLYDKSGSAYIFEKPSSGWVNATQNKKLKSSDGAEDDRFGHKVAMNENTIVISAYKHDSLGVESGAVYVYEKPVQGWVSAIENAKLTASDGNTNDYFGTDIDISGDTIVVGALLNDDSGCAYVFEKPIKGYWVSTGENAKLTASDNLPGDYFAFSVAISEESIVIGAYANDGTGSIYIYDKDNAWESATQNAKLTASNANNDDRFGESVAISADTIVVGGSYSYDRSAYIFKAKEENAINPSIIMYLLN